MFLSKFLYLPRLRSYGLAKIQKTNSKKNSMKNQHLNSFFETWNISCVLWHHICDPSFNLIESKLPTLELREEG